MQDVAIRAEENPCGELRRAVKMDGTRMGRRLTQDFRAYDYG